MYSTLDSRKGRKRDRTAEVEDQEIAIALAASLEEQTSGKTGAFADQTAAATGQSPVTGLQLAQYWSDHGMAYQLRSQHSTSSNSHQGMAYQG